MALYRPRPRREKQPSLFDDAEIKAAVRGVSRTLLKRIHAISIVEAGRIFGREPQATRFEIENVRRESSLERLTFLAAEAKDKNVSFEHVAASFLAEWERAYGLKIVPVGSNHFGLEPFYIETEMVEANVAEVSSLSAGKPDEPSATVKLQESPYGKPRKQNRAFEGPGDGSQWDIPLGEPTFGGG